MHDISTEEGIPRKFRSLLPSMNERVRRHWAAAEATAIGRGGIALVARATGLSRTTIRTGMRQLKTREDSDDGLPLSRGQPVVSVDATGLVLNVCHFPPGTSKWNKIEHRLFCPVTQNWRGRPLTSHDLIVKLIGGTTTSKGLKVKAALDTALYESGIKVSDEELNAVNIERNEFHGE